MAEAVVQDIDVPAPGQLVTVRNRVWVASDVVRGSIAGADDTVLTGRAPHLVSLVSIEDDAREERLRVVWELEPGAMAHDQHALPDPAGGFDDPRELDAFLDAVRWGAIASADKTVLQAPFRSGIQIEEYQLDPWCGRCPCRALTCSSPMTSGSARRSRRGWSPKSCCSATGPGRC